MRAWYKFDVIIYKITARIDQKQKLGVGFRSFVGVGGYLKSISFFDLSQYVNNLGLGFIFTLSLSPRSHITSITCKAFKLLGYIRRVSSEFKLKNSLKSLYCALVRPILEYGSVVWDPHCSDLGHQLEGVQRKFLNYASYS